MNSNKKIVYIVLFFAIFFLLFNVKSYAGTQKWNSLNYDVTVNSDGSMDVIETWDIKISETNTIFKDFVIDYSKYSGITNVKVSEIDDGKEIPLEQIYEEQYHVDIGCYYALPINNNEIFEIAWNVGLDNSTSTKTYKLYYTIENVVKIYNDCSELYWMFLDTVNEIPGKNITGTIKLPKEVSDIEKLRVWAHGDLSGTINRDSKDTVSFSLPSLYENTRLEIRVVTEENIFEECTNMYSSNELEYILKEEQGWADKANRQRTLYKFYYILAVILFVVSIIFFYKKMKEYEKRGKEIIQKYKYNIPDIEYFREIPDEKNATPARAVYLRRLSSTNTVIDDAVSKIFSATILDLSVKGLLEFEPINNKDFKIIINNKKVELTNDEEYVYNLLLDASRKTDATTNYITSKDFSKYARKNYDDFYYLKNKFEVNAKKYHNDCGNIDNERLRVVKEWNNTSIIYILMLFIGIFFTVFSIPLMATYPIQYGLIVMAIAISLIVGSAMNLFSISKVTRNISILSEKGYIERQEWNALEKYMKEYSLLKEKQVFDVVLWEKFLVYATAFGISKKVIEQLKLVHPEAFEVNNRYNSNYAYWYLISDNRFGENTFDSFGNMFEGAYKSAMSAYSAAHSIESSGSGSGGGFSSGGGGRRWRRRLRRPLNSK